MRNNVTNEKYMDVFVLGEPLACVMHAYRRLPETLEVRTITIFGAGSIGALHALYARSLSIPSPWSRLSSPMNVGAH